MAATEGPYQGPTSLRPVLDTVQADSARLSGSDTLKYEELYPVSAGWPPGKQDPFQPHDNWDAFCRRQKQEYAELDSNLREFDGVDEKLRQLEVRWKHCSCCIITYFVQYHAICAILSWMSWLEGHGDLKHDNHDSPLFRL